MVEYGGCGAISNVSFAFCFLSTGFWLQGSEFQCFGKVLGHGEIDSKSLFGTQDGLYKTRHSADSPSLSDKLTEHEFIFRFLFFSIPHPVTPRRAKKVRRRGSGSGPSEQREPWKALPHTVRKRRC